MRHNTFWCDHVSHMVRSNDDAICHFSLFVNLSVSCEHLANRVTVKLKNTALLPLVFPFFFSISFKLSLYHCLRRPTSLCQKVFLSFPPSPQPSSWKSIALSLNPIYICVNFSTEIQIIRAGVWVQSKGNIVRFGGNLAQLFRHIPWTPVQSLLQIPLLEKSTLKG